VMMAARDTSASSCPPTTSQLRLPHFDKSQPSIQTRNLGECSLIAAQMQANRREVRQMKAPRGAS
jgi:hypothetical protein